MKNWLYIKIKTVNSGSAYQLLSHDLLRPALTNFIWDKEMNYEPTPCKHATIISIIMWMLLRSQRKEKAVDESDFSQPWEWFFSKIIGNSDCEHINPSSCLKAWLEWDNNIIQLKWCFVSSWSMTMEMIVAESVISGAVHQCFPKQRQIMSDWFQILVMYHHQWCTTM